MRDAQPAILLRAVLCNKVPIKLIVTHKQPDLDAIGSVWLLQRFDEQNFGTAEYAFVNPGEEISTEELGRLGATSYQVTHVDTGGGEFDHHSQELAGSDYSASKLVLDHIIKIHPEFEHDQALKRVVKHITAIDHFAQGTWPERKADRSYFQLDQVLAELKSIGLKDAEMLEFGMVALDSVYATMKQVVHAEALIEEATKFETESGPGIAEETANGMFSVVAQKHDYAIVIKLDPNTGSASLKARPDSGIDLRPIYEKISSLDSSASWYLHPSNKMLINGSNKRRGQVPTRLSLKQLVTLVTSTK